MEEAFVQLTCPTCSKAWEVSPRDLPTPQTAFECPDCGTERPTAEFARTDRDLKTLKQLG